MNLKDMQKEFVEICSVYNKKNNVKHNPDFTFHHLVEEVGELSREIIKDKNDWRKEGFDKQKLADEINDVICGCLLLADDYEIDLEEPSKDPLSLNLTSIFGRLGTQLMKDSIVVWILPFSFILSLIPL